MARYHRIGDHLITQKLEPVTITGRMAPGWFFVTFDDGQHHDGPVSFHGRHLHRDTPEVRAWLSALADYEAYQRETSALIRAEEERVWSERLPAYRALGDRLTPLYLKARHLNPYD